MSVKRIKLIFHILFFSTIGCILFFGYSYSIDVFFSKDFFTRDIFEIILVTLTTYLYYYKIFTNNTFLRVKIKWLLFNIFLFSITAINKEWLSMHQSIINTFMTLSQYVGFSAILFFVLWLIDNVDFLIYENYFEIKKMLKEAESKLLRQQLNPHFLFNAFNSLYSLSLQNNPKTPDTILKLSEMMRYITDELFVSKVKLSRELRFIENYLAIEKIRFGENSNINYKFSGDISNLIIEPLLLITLVENAFKHGFHTNDAFVTISATTKNHFFLFTVENSMIPEYSLGKRHRKGKGLNNLKKRLQLSYPKKHELLIQNKGNIHLTELKLNLQ